MLNSNNNSTCPLFRYNNVYYKKIGILKNPGHVSASYKEEAI